MILIEKDPEHCRQGQCPTCKASFCVACNGGLTDSPVPFKKMCGDHNWDPCPHALAPRGFAAN